jgi:hypothetical protein
MTEDYVTPEDLARALAEIAAWVANIRLIVLQLPAGTHIPWPGEVPPPPNVDWGGCMPKLPPKTY